MVGSMLITYNPLREGLELQLELLTQLERTSDGDSVCIVCYQLADTCQCEREEKVYWPLTHAIRMLENVIGEMRSAR